jgi:hypothetical protein
MPENELRYATVKRDNIASFFAATSLAFYTSYANDGLDPGDDQAFGRRVGQRAQQHGVQQAEHGGVSADAEGERAGGDGEEARVLQEEPDGQPDVGEEAAHGRCFCAGGVPRGE